MNDGTFQTYYLQLVFAPMLNLNVVDGPVTKMLFDILN